MSLKERLREIAEDRLAQACDGAVQIAYDASPLDLGPLREAIVAIDQNWEGDTLVSGVEWGEPDVTRQRGYYPAIINKDPRYGHAGFVNDIAEEIRQNLGELLR